jgi:histidinol-phosphate aminotransferase
VSSNRFQGYESPQLEARVRLNSNESPLPPPKEWMEDFLDELAKLDLNRYPDRHHSRLREALAAHHGVDASMIWCGSGSNEVIMTALTCFGGPGKKALLAEPTYRLHSYIAARTFTEAAIVDRTDDFSFPPEAVSSTQADLVFLCSPNNPTGLLETPEAVEAALSLRQSMVILDEAYAPFAGRSFLERALSAGNCLVVRTFSKSFGLAGVRVGYAIGPREAIADLERVSLPYNVSAPSQLAAALALRHADAFKARCEAIASTREWVKREIEAMGLAVIPSSANFLTFFTEPAPAESVFKALLERSVLVRSLRDFPRLSGALRVTIGTEAEMHEFLEALSAAVKELS